MKTNTDVWLGRPAPGALFCVLLRVGIGFVAIFGDPQRTSAREVDRSVAEIRIDYANAEGKESTSRSDS